MPHRSFRIWDKKSKEFVWKGFSLSTQGKLLRFNSEVEDVENFVLNFNTGFKDKYEKDIFEDDVLEHTIAKGGDIQTFQGIVEFEPKLAAFTVDGIPMFQLFSIRKLGNPYEFPLLYNSFLKKK